MFVASMNPAGAFNFAQGHGSTGNSVANAVAVYSEGMAIVAGMFSGVGITFGGVMQRFPEQTVVGK
eukprot:7882845-Pyramimonas_sp.AAC.1